MNALLRAALGILLVFAGAVGAAPPPDANVDERLIIVSFVDRGIQAAPLATPGDFYSAGPVGASGGYASTPWSRRLTDRLARDYALELVTDWPIASLGVHCAVFRVGADVVIEDLLAQLGTDARVDGVQRMNAFRALRAAPGRTPGDPLSAIELDAAHRLSTGRDVRIAVVDTGIDVHHPDLVGQIVETRDLVSDSAGDHDELHGTAVAGVIAALAGNDEGIVGVAPGARLTALRACWPVGPTDAGAICNSLTLARALDAVVRLKPQVLNLSLTGPADPLLGALLAKIVEAGVVVVAASPGEDTQAGFPTSVPGIIEVAAAEMPARTDAALIRAPGMDILTTFPHGQYDFISGSSFAAAHVSGVIALLLELHPDLPAAELRGMLTRAGNEAAPGAAAPARPGYRAASDERLCTLMSHLGHRLSCAAEATTPPAPRKPQAS